MRVSSQWNLPLRLTWPVRWVVYFGLWLFCALLFQVFATSFDPDRRIETVVQYPYFASLVLGVLLGWTGLDQSLLAVMAAAGLGAHGIAMLALADRRWFQGLAVAHLTLQIATLAAFAFLVNQSDGCGGGEGGSVTPPPREQSDGPAGSFAEGRVPSFSRDT